MKLLRQKFEIIDQEEGVDGIFKIIELAGRTCYKSYDKITPNSAKAFVYRMIKSGHGAMLEHGSVYLSIPVNVKDIDDNEMVGKYKDNPYSIVSIMADAHGGASGTAYVSTNLRVIIENEWTDDLKYLCTPTPYHERRVTVLFTCDRVTGESFLRHRKIDEDQPSVEGEVTREMENDINSFARESTRYCNYTKAKFGSELTFIQPSEISGEDVTQTQIKWEYGCKDDYDDRMFRNICCAIAANENSDEDDDMFGIVDTWLFAGLATQWVYNRLIRLGWKPQQARRKLTMDIKSPLVMTAFVSDWRHFFQLRAAPDAHPQAQELAYPLQKEFIRRHYINL